MAEPEIVLDGTIKVRDALLRLRECDDNLSIGVRVTDGPGSYTFSRRVGQIRALPTRLADEMLQDAFLSNMEFYCMKCRAHRRVTDIGNVCPVCGTKAFRSGKEPPSHDTEVHKAAKADKVTGVEGVESFKMSEEAEPPAHDTEVHTRAKADKVIGLEMEESFKISEEAKSPSPPVTPEPTRQAQPEAGPASSPRFVQAQVIDLEQGSTVIKHGPLEPAHQYGLDVWIGPPSEEAIRASTIFHEEKLPPTKDGLWLTVVLTAPAVRTEPQVSRLWLPKENSSKSVSFDFTPRKGMTSIEARITVLHENRVVQELLLTAGVGDGADPQFKMAVEAVIGSNLNALGGRPRFDAALLFNEVASATTATGFAGDCASMIRTDDTIDRYITSIKSILELATSRPKNYGPPSSKGTTALLAELARNGSLLYEAMLTGMPGIRPDLEDAERIQIIAARPDRVLPIEFCYDAHPPSEKASMCGQWEEALKEGKCDRKPGSEKCRAALNERKCAKEPRSEECREALKEGKCAMNPCLKDMNQKDMSQVVCPIAFWATTRIIERHTYSLKDATKLGYHDFALQTEPLSEHSRLNVLERSLCAAAKQARAFDPQGVDDAFAIIKKTTKSAKEVDTWDEWKKEIKDSHPSLLVLLAHTEAKGTIDSLVIGDDQAALFTQIDKEFVSPDPGLKPVVLLLGCSTATEEYAFQSFVGRFRDFNASIVVGTLCKILGREAAPIAKGLTEKLRAAASSNEGKPMGDFMRELRRELLVAGHPMVLAVTAFGDADWLI